MEMAVRNVRQTATQINKTENVESIGFAAKLLAIAFATMVVVCVGAAVINDPKLLVTAASAANFM